MKNIKYIVWIIVLVGLEKLVSSFNNILGFIVGVVGLALILYYCDRKT